AQQSPPPLKSLHNDPVGRVETTLKEMFSCGFFAN
ncbi:MAG: hypothetical protein ACI9FZ_001443, partial [Bacteroidia bacterium]